VYEHRGWRVAVTCETDGVSLQVWLAVALALVTAFLYALSNVLELTEAEQVPDEEAASATLMAHLIRKPRWWLGLGADVFGYVTQASAIALAAVIFVEPILATGIVMSLILGAFMTHRKIRAVDWLWAALLSGGLALFLYEVLPTGGRDFIPNNRAVIAMPAIVGAMGACILAAGGFRGSTRSALLGVAAGISFGAAAVLTKSVVSYLGDGIFDWVPHWEPYALALASVGGVVINQSAFQTGALAASVGAMESMAPLSAAILGIVLLDEHVEFESPFQVFAVVCSIAIVLIGIMQLARAEERIVVGDVVTRVINEPATD